MDLEQLLAVSLKVSIAIFMAGNLLEMGLRLEVGDALRGLRAPRFVISSLLWGFVLCPAVAWGLTRLLPLEEPYAVGLLLLGMTPCAPFLPMLVQRAGGGVGSTAAFMLLASIGLVLYMPVAVPLLIPGLTVDAWSIARPLLVLVALPLSIGMALLRSAPKLAARLQPFVKKTSLVATIAVLGLCLAIYGEEFLGIAGSLAIASQTLFFTIVTLGPYVSSFDLRREQRIVLTLGMTTRNLGAALAPLFAAAHADQRAVIMVVLGVPMQVIFALLAARAARRRAGGPHEADADGSEQREDQSFPATGKG